MRRDPDVDRLLPRVGRDDRVGRPQERLAEALEVLAGPRAVGQPAVRAMETGFGVVRTLVSQGPAAVWEPIRESLGNLRQTVVDGLIDSDRPCNTAATQASSCVAIGSARPCTTTCRPGTCAGCGCSWSGP